jgi:Zn-dependent M16 (insulinase) family peptidase
MELVELLHEPTGARVMHIAADDTENLFCLSFQTWPSSSNGVAHILEHTVLCGSRRFPVRDPFFSMTRRSMNTYMNALTGSDFTCYPASSQIETDFYNLLDVYLDAVFEPRLDRWSFLQEGHRFEFDADGRLSIEGIVYNEMKGARNSPDDRLHNALMKALTPDLPYALDSGGDPAEIPNLTHEELRAFHSTFYHPSRCLFFFYGNLPLEKHLDFIEKKVLSSASKMPPLGSLPAQPRFSSPVRLEERYPAQGEEAKDLFAIAWLTVEASNSEELLALELLDSILMETDASPLKEALLRSAVVKQVHSSLDSEMKEVPYVLVGRGGEDVARFEEIVLSELNRIATEGVPDLLISSALHALEFERTEIGGSGGPFGLSLFFRAALPKQHGGEAESALLIHTLLSRLKQKLADPDYLPSLIRTYFLENPHRVTLRMVADPGMEEKERKKEEEWLQEIAPFLPREKIEQDTKELEAIQDGARQQSLDCLPLLSLSEIPEEPRDYPLIHEEIRGLEIFHYEGFTNGILYADLHIDLPATTDLATLSFFSRILTELGAGGKNYKEKLQDLHGSVGELTSGLSLYASEDTLSPTLFLHGKALASHGPALLQHMVDFLTSPDFLDTRRLQELLSQHHTALEHRLSQNAMYYALLRSSSELHKAANIQEQLGGIPYLLAIRRFAKAPIELLQESLLKLLPLKISHPHLVLSADSETKRSLPLRSFADSLPIAQALPFSFSPRLSPFEKEGYELASPVAFTAKTQLVSPFDPSYLVSANLLETLLLHPQIREKGGAYGAKASYAPYTGLFTFSSYRDPHLKETLQTFQGRVEPDADDLYEAKLEVLQDLDGPVPPGQRAQVAYGSWRTKRTYPKRQAFRKSIIALELNDLKFPDPKRGSVVSMGNRDLLGELGTPIQNL